MSRVRSLISFASWNYGAQLATVVLQFGYAAVTSRLVDDVGFGAYAVALSVSALVTLLANGGLGQAVSRMHTLNGGRISALGVCAIGLGIAGSAVVFFTADFAAQLWATPAAADPIRILALAALLSPLSGLLAGLLRRQQRFRALAAAVVGANTAGMVVGVLAVLVKPGPPALVVSPTVATITLTISTLALNRSSVFVRPLLKEVSNELQFSWKVTGLSVLSYLNGNVGRWAVSRGVGADVLGQWNRADVLITVPLEQAHRAVQQAIYPEFRHDIGGNARTRDVWTDLQILMGWMAFPLAALAGVLAPVAIPILFGPGWDLAAQLALPLSLILAFQLVSTTLSAALEAVGRFRWILSTHLITLSIQAAGAFLAISMSEWWPVFFALAAGKVVTHGVHLALCSGQQMIRLGRLTRGYVEAASVAIVLGSVIWLLTGSIAGIAPVWSGVIAAAILLLGLLLTWRYRRVLTPVAILARYRPR